MGANRGTRRKQIAALIIFMLLLNEVLSAPDAVSGYILVQLLAGLSALIGAARADGSNQLLQQSEQNPLEMKAPSNYSGSVFPRMQEKKDALDDRQYSFAVESTPVEIFTATQITDGTIHNKPVIVMVNAPCRENPSSGYSGTGYICQIENTGYYLKETDTYKGFMSSHELSATPDHAGYISFNEFNSQFAEEIIGITVPKTKFFKNKDTGALYLGSQEINNLRLGSSESPISDKQLGQDGVAKLLVASTFIGDLHADNWGFTHEGGLVLIDLDAAGTRPTGIDMIIDDVKNNMQRALTDKTAVQVTLKDIIAMKSIYDDMLTRELPAFHDDFFITRDDYLKIIRVYTRACEETIHSIQRDRPELEHDTPVSTETFVDRFAANCEIARKHVALEEPANKPGVGRPKSI